VSSRLCLQLCWGIALSVPTAALCVLQVSAHTEQTALAARYANGLNVPSPKGRDVLCRIQQDFQGAESLLSAETPPKQPPVPAEGGN